MMVYKNTEVKFSSPDGDTDFFDIVANVLQGDIWATYLFINYLDYALRKSIDLMKWLYTKKDKQQTIPGINYYRRKLRTNYYGHGLVNTLTQAKFLLHSLEQAASGIGLHVNANKTEYMCFNKKGNISVLNGGSMKQVNKFIYLGSSV